MRPRRGRASEPEDGRADRTVRAPQFVWALIVLVLVLGFVGLAVLFARG